MALNLSTPQPITEMKPRIVVIGVGGAGGNAVNNMIRSNLEGVEFIVGNTDAQALEHSDAERKIQLGLNITQGLGAGARPEIGRAAAEETMDDMLQHLQGANMVFITAGMGGGTGTGAAPVIAQAAREAGILTVGVVTKPFHFEGSQRMKIADGGIEELQQYVDTLIIIPNQNLFRVANEKTTFADAFKMADDVLYSGVRGVTDLMVMPGLINLDFADIRTVMGEMGKAMMGTGESEGETRAIAAAESAISNPLLEDVTMKGARGVLINITGGGDMTLFEVDEAANRIREEVDPEANIIFGSTFDETLEGKMRVSVVATGIDGECIAASRPFSRPLASAVAKPLPDAKLAAKESSNEIIASAETTEHQDVDNETSADVTEETTLSSVDGADENSELSRAVDAINPVTENLFAEEEAERADTTSKPDLSTRPLPDENTPSAPEPRDSFIPPRPVRPEELGNEVQKEADPFAEADMANGSKAESAAKPKPNLFQRVTGLMGHKDEAPHVAPTLPGATAKNDGNPTGNNAPKIIAVTSDNRAGQLSAEEELLEIPAFLRRQAN